MVNSSTKQGLRMDNENYFRNDPTDTEQIIDEIKELALSVLAIEAILEELLRRNKCQK